MLLDWRLGGKKHDLQHRFAQSSENALQKIANSLLMNTFRRTPFFLC